MQIVIDIPELMYKNAKKDMLCGSETLVNAIKNGKVIEQLPPVSVAEKVGCWVEIDDEPYEVWECDKCGLELWWNGKKGVEQ